MPSKHHAHWLVAKTAKEMAQEVYEANCSASNEFYRRHPDRKAWVEAVYGSLLDQARRALAALLGTSQISEKEKEQVHEALVLDASLNRRHTNRVFHVN